VKEFIRDHDFVDGTCRWCGGRSSEFLTRSLTCVPRWIETPASSTPTSIFSDLGAIGQRMRQIQAEEQPSAPDDFEASEDRATRANNSTEAG
jgi:hypothetical protein